MTSVPIQSLVQSLTDEFGQPEPNGGKIAQLLRDYSASHQDWRSYALVSPRCYTRNLVELNDQYELLVLCWDTNQCSPVHNHEGQDCWMAVLEGPMEEVHYEAPTSEGPLACGPVRRFETGQVAYISDEIALHLVRAHESGPAVSLHLYAKPYGECNCYCEETGKITRKKLAYYSVHGVLTGASECPE